MKIINIPPSFLISAVLFSGSLVKQDGHGATRLLPPRPPPPLERPTVPFEATTRRALVSTVLIATLLISALGLGRSYCPWYTYMKRCHKRDQARIKCVGAVRVREIMRPPTNQSIRRHLSDCSLTSGCPVPPSLSLLSRRSYHLPPPLLADPGSARLPEAGRCRTPTRAWSRIRRISASSNGDRDVDWPGIEPGELASNAPL